MAADRHASFLNSVTSTLHTFPDLAALMRFVNDTIVRHFQVDGILWAAAADDADLPRAVTPRVDSGAVLDGTVTTYLDDQARDELMAGRPVVVCDVGIDARTAGAAESLRDIGVAALLVVPASLSGNTRALCCVHVSAARSWCQEEVDTLSRVVKDVWPAIERFHTQHALMVSEERLQLATRGTGVGVFDYDVNADRSYWSPELCAIRGVPAGTQPRLAELVSTVHEDDRARFSATVRAAFDPSGCGVFCDEFRVHRWDTGEIRWLTNSGQAFFEGTGDARRVVRVAGIVRDITEQKSREAHDHFLSELGDAWIRARDVVTLLQVTEDGIRRHLQITGVSFIGIAADAPLRVDDLLSDPEWTDLASGWWIAIHDVAADPRTAASRDRLLANGIAAFIDVPLCDENGLASVMRVTVSAPRIWRAEDVRMLQQLATRLCAALERARAEEALRESEARQAFVLRFNDALRPLSDPNAIQELAATMLHDHLHAYRVSCSDIDGDDVILRHYCGAAPPPSRTLLDLYPQALLEATSRGELVAVSDIRTDPRLTDEERAALLTRDYLGFVAVVRLDRGRKVAALAVRSDVPRKWTQAETDLVRLIAERTWDAVERVRAQAALRESEERLRLATRNAAIGVLDYDVVKDVAAWSPELCALLGVPENGSPTLAEGLQLCHPDDRAYVETALARCLDPDGPGTFGEEFRICRADTGEHRWLSVTCQALFEGGGDARRPMRIIGIATDVTERKTREAHERFLIELNDALRLLSDASAVQSTAARLLGTHLRVSRVGYAKIGNGRYAIRQEYADGVAPNVGEGPVGTFGAALHDAYRRGETVVVNDVQTDPRFTDAERTSLRARDLRAFISVTLVKDGELVAAFGANHSSPRVWTAAEIDLVRMVAERTWEAAERARIEDALRASEHKLRLSLQAAKLGIWQYNLQTELFDADATAKTMHGMTADASIASLEDASRYLYPADLPENQRRFTRTVHDGVPFEHEYRVVLPTGDIRWIASLGMAQADTCSVYGVVQDVTTRKQAELALQEHDRDQENTLRLLLETAAQGIILFNGPGTIVTANRACETMFGWTAGELIGASVEELLPPLLVDGCMGLVGKRKDGTTFPVEVSLNHVTTRDGGCAMAFVTDISLRRQAEQALQERSAELERQAVQLRRLASDLTLAEQRAREQLAKTLHDGLQQLLFAVSLKLAQLESASASRTTSASLIAEARVDVDEAINAARSLSLDLFPAGLIAGRLTAAVKWLATWVRSKYRLLVHVSADPSVDIERNDVRTLLLESLRELLLNVVKHADVDCVAVDLARDAAGALIITVADDGKGFDAKTLFDTATPMVGGLGMISIRERLALLGGRLDVESAPGLGTRCRLIVPAAAATEASVVTRPAEPAAAGRAAPGRMADAAGRPLRVLLVDDHPGTLKAIRQMLANLSRLEVIGEARNGVEAIGLARALRPDVIVMDISMPEMNGVEATQRIHNEMPDIRIVGLSSYDKGDGLHPIEEAGASGYFRKGIDNQQLVEYLVGVRADDVSASVRM